MKPSKYSLDTMPANQQRLPAYQMDDDWIIAFLHRAQIGHIATHWDEQPFITPSTYWYNEAKQEIYFHSNITGRVRANCERYPEVCFEASEFGKFLPSNIALEFSLQYESVIVFGKIRILEQSDEKEQALYGLIAKYFPDMLAGKDYRPITEKELKHTSVYAIKIKSWSGKRNWAESAEQSQEWKP